MVLDESKRLRGVVEPVVGQAVAGGDPRGDGAQLAHQLEQRVDVFQPGGSAGMVYDMPHTSY